MLMLFCWISGCGMRRKTLKRWVNLMLRFIELEAFFIDQKGQFVGAGGTESVVLERATCMHRPARVAQNSNKRKITYL